MAEDREKMLNQEIEAYEEQLQGVAYKLQELMGVDCNFGACVFDPEMKDAEARLADLEKRKKNLQDVIKALKECETG
jgi:phage shock protein A